MVSLPRVRPHGKAEGSPVQLLLSEMRRDEPGRMIPRKSSHLFVMTVRRMALAGNLPYAKLVDENAFTPFVRNN